MAEQSTPHKTVAAPVAASVGRGSMQRMLSGTSFLSLEHAAHMALVVVVPLVMLAAIASLCAMWGGMSMGPGTMVPMLALAGPEVHAMATMSMVASLLVMVPLLVVLGKRTRAEWQKRPGYTARVAYKVPVYTALALLAVFKVSIAVNIIAVVLTSFALIGTGANIGALYVSQFVPVAVAGALVGAASWYVFQLAKGRDYGKTFELLLLAVSGGLVAALFITSVVTLHSGSAGNDRPRYDDYNDMYRGGMDDSDLESIFNGRN